MRRISHFILAAALLGLFVVPVAHAQKARSFERSKRGFRRDLRRVAKLPRVSSLTQLLDSGSKFSGKLSAQSPWAMAKRDGRKPFTVDLGGGCKIEGASYHLNLPVAKVNKLLQLDIVKGGKRVSLMPNSKRPVLLGADTSYNFIDNKVNWHGPQSRFALLSLLHEFGHAKDYGKMGDKQRAEFGKIYDTAALKKPLTSSQHRKLVGFERSAWAHALKKARGLERQGVDIFGGASSKEVMSTIYSCMKGYYEYEGKK
jgi:hypothetical protein